MNCLQCDVETLNPKFCGRSCSAIYNNKHGHYPKRSLEGSCDECGKKIKSSLKFCNDECRISSMHPRSPEERAAINVIKVGNRRRAIKEILLEEAGGKCLDCGYVGPPFMFDFDHRDPSEKQFTIAAGRNVISLDKLREEASKCDLVCAICHRMRTHKQRCSGCDYCI